MDGIPNIVKRYLLGSMVYGGVHAMYFGTRVAKSVESHRLSAGKIVAASVVTSLASPVLWPLLWIEGVDYVDKRFVLKLPMEKEMPPVPYTHFQFLV